MFMPTARNQKMKPGKLYCWENSDYTIEILEVKPGRAKVKGWKITTEPIHTDSFGNEFVKIGYQTYYAFAKC